MSYKVLHVSSHYGGGIGTVVKSWVENDTENIHKLTYLNDISNQIGELFKPDLVNYYDFVIVHVWNHPALWDFIVNTQLPPCRLIGWAHMSGLHAPYVLFDKLVNYFDEFFFTSPVSNLTGIKKDYIWSTGTISKYINLPKKEHKGFNVGYIGTLDFCKIHPDFIDICSKIDIPEVRFTVIGEGCDSDILKEQAKEKNLNIEFIGLVKDIKPYLSEFDVFLYPLYEKHFGTCEQILGEILASKIPCVVLDNPAEIYIIDHLTNGFIGKNIPELIDHVHKIYNYYSKSTLDYITNQGEKSALKIYSIDKKIQKWNKIFSKEILKDKKLRSWSGEKDPFTESLGECGRFFKQFIKAKKEGDSYLETEFAIPGIKELFKKNPYQWRSKSKGSIQQYIDYFSENKYLKNFLELL